MQEQQEAACGSRARTQETDMGTASRTRQEGGLCRGTGRRRPDQMGEGAWEWGSAADSDVGARPGDLWFVEAALVLREDIGRGKGGNRKTSHLD